MKKKIFFCHLFFIFGFVINFVSAEKLVSLQGTNSQNSQYVEIRRSPKKSTDITDESIPKAHGLSTTNTKKSTTELRRRPQKLPTTYPNGISSPIAPIMMFPSMMSPFPNLLNYYPQIQPIPSPSISYFHQQPQQHVQQQHLQMLPTPSSSLSSNSIQTLSPTLAPTMPTISPISFPTFPTLFPMATFPAFTLPPSFDKMAAGYMKKDKKKRKKHRRKPTKKIHNSDENNSDLDEKTEKTLPKIESRLPKFADEQNPSKTSEKDWMVPYYADDKKNQS